MLPSTLAAASELAGDAGSVSFSASGAGGAATDDGAESNGSGGSSSNNSSSNNNSKRKRVVLAIHDKQQVLQRLDEGEQPAAIARAYGISRQQVSDIKKNRERILSYCVDAKHVASLRRKTLKVTTEYHPGVEQELYRWLVRQRLLGRAVATDALTNKATELFMQYAGDDSSTSFKTIMSWLRQFKRAHGIKALNDEEIAKLPERFVPAMDMVQTLPSGDLSHRSSLLSLMSPTAAAAGGANMSMNLAMLMTPSSGSVTVEEYISGMSNSLGLHLNPQQQHMLIQHHHTPVQQQSLTQLQTQQQDDINDAAPPRSPLASAVSCIHEINAQLSYFEREMALKLDDLDARVEKLGFLVLPPRFA